jgi:hypothetical protein
MDACPECRAFLQPDWDRCKICGHVLGTPTTAETEAAVGKKRRSRRAAPTPAEAPPKATRPARRERPARTPAPAAVATGGATGPPSPSFPPLFTDEGAPVTTSPPERTPSGRAGWLVGGVVVVAAAVGAWLVLGGEDEPDQYADRAAGESAEGAADPTALGDWGRYPVGAVTVDLPAPPFVDETVEQILVIGEMGMVRGEVLSDGLTYTVAAGPLPDGVADRDPDELIGRVVDRWATAEAGTVQTSEQITVDGAPAVRAAISGLERDTHLVAIIDDGMLIELRVAGQEPDPAALQRMIDTFDR